MDKKAIYSSIHNEYASTRNRNSVLLDQRKEQLFLKFPRLKQIEDQLSRIGVDAARYIVKNPDNYEVYLKELEILSENLRKEKAQFMDTNGIPLDYLEDIYSCKVCKDTGYLNNGDKCECFRRKLADRFFKYSNMESLLETENFELFKLDVFSQDKLDGRPSQKENMANNLFRAEKFVMDFEKSDYENLLMYGPSGQGKTFLCSSIAKYLIDRGYSVVYLTSFKLIDLIRSIRFSNDIADNTQEKYSSLLEVDLLIIDDLGTELITNFTKSEIFNIVNSRINDKKSTIISTNMKLNELIDTYSSRIASRIIGNFEPMEFYGPDIRWETR